jgi:hypothetical protein
LSGARPPRGSSPGRGPVDRTKGSGRCLAAACPGPDRVRAAPPCPGRAPGGLSASPRPLGGCVRGPVPARPSGGDPLTLHLTSSHGKRRGSAHVRAPPLGSLSRCALRLSRPGRTHAPRVPAPPKPGARRRGGAAWGTGDGEPEFACQRERQGQCSPEGAIPRAAGVAVWLQVLEEAELRASL